MTDEHDGGLWIAGYFAMIAAHPELFDMYDAIRRNPVLCPSGSLPALLEDALAAARAKAPYRPTAVDVRPSGVTPDGDLLRALGFELQD